jgi:deoxyribodipyrimidine photo-lyase
MQSPRHYPAADNRYHHGLLWFRRDLRLDDQAALYYALRCCERVSTVFLLDRDLLDPLPRRDRRVVFILECLRELEADLREHGGGLHVLHGRAPEAIVTLAARLGVDAVFANHDYEPSAIERDARVAAELSAAGIAWHSYKDQVIFERDEILTREGRPYGVFTPYKGAWLREVDRHMLRAYPSRSRLNGRLAPPLPGQSGVPAAQAIGFEQVGGRTEAVTGGSSHARTVLSGFRGRMARYAEARDYPAQRGVSYLSTHLRFGTVSIRELARMAHARASEGDAGAATWLSELIWRDFYFQVLAHHPHVVRSAFRPEYDRIRWVDDDSAFAAWCEGRTGYPIVDAAMAQINRSGYMHNRLRMIVASFLIKDLGIDWRRGEQYFAQQLNDFDLSANNGGWQWAASSGCDAQPYFRIFNPVSQSRKFDPQGKFIRRYLPQLAKLSDQDVHAPWLARPIDLQAAGVRLGVDYPLPIVDHDQARRATLERYSVVKSRAIGEDR